MDFNHCSVIAKKNIDTIADSIKIGEGGVITTYLPEKEKFVVYFGDKRWYSFDQDENSFLENFEVIQDYA